MSAIDDRSDGPEDAGREGLAAEYALGTLDGVERAAVAARLDVDPALAASVAWWEGRLAPLADGVADVPAPSGVWPAVEARLASFASPGLRVIEGGAPATAAARPSGGGWRALAIAASLAALAFGGLLARNLGAVAPTSAEPLVAVLASDGKAPAFLVSVDVAKRELVVRRVGAEGAPDHSHELWLVSDKVGKPVSLGVVGDRQAAAQLAKYDPATFESATYAISLEPKGGSPTGQPTGPVVFSGKLTPLGEPPAR